MKHYWRDFEGTNIQKDEAVNYIYIYIAPLVLHAQTTHYSHTNVNIKSTYMYKIETMYERALEAEVEAEAEAETPKYDRLRPERQNKRLLNSPEWMQKLKYVQPKHDNATLYFRLWDFMH